MRLNSNNIIIITTTLPNNPISEKRRNNLIKNFNKYGISILFIQGKKETNKLFFEIMKKRIEVFIKTNYTYAVLCDDDFFPIDNFLEELNKNVDLLPNDWKCLHLCPGYLWGRNFRDKSKIGKLNPVYNMDGIKYNKNGRFYIDCNPETYQQKKFWMGGPISMLINKNSAQELLHKFINDFKKDKIKNKKNNDVILTRILDNKCFVCRQPQLGYEEECGKSSYKQV